MQYTIKVKSHVTGEIKDFAFKEASVHQITNQPNLRRFVGPVPVEVDPQPTTIGWGRASTEGRSWPLYCVGKQARRMSRLYWIGCESFKMQMSFSRELLSHPGCCMILKQNCAHQSFPRYITLVIIEVWTYRAPFRATIYLRMETSTAWAPSDEVLMSWSPSLTFLKGTISFSLIIHIDWFDSPHWARQPGRSSELQWEPSSGQEACHRIEPECFDCLLSREV